MNLLQKIFISLGSNQGNRIHNLQEAIDLMYQNIGNVIAISKTYETTAWGFESEHFLNCCVEITSDLNPDDLLTALQNIESILGRQKKQSDHYEARPIDLDILFYGETIISEPHLQIPHKLLANRNFVLQPLFDIAAEFNHPKLNKTVTHLLNECTDEGVVKATDDILDNSFNPSRLSKLNWISIEGNIGSGKTTLATKLAADCNAKLVLEKFTENPFLSKFYTDKSRYAFAVEMNFLADRHQQLNNDIVQYDLSKEFIVADYHISKSLTFAKITLAADEFELYHRYFNLIQKDTPQPDVYVYLYQNTDRLLQNIKKRGRDYEQDIKADYLDRIHKGYLDFITNQPHLNVKVIDVTNLDFENNRSDYVQVLEQILS